MKKGHDEDTALPTNKSELYDVLHRLDKRLLPTTKTGDLRKNPSTRDMLECANEYALDGGRAARARNTGAARAAANPPARGAATTTAAHEPSRSLQRAVCARRSFDVILTNHTVGGRKPCATADEAKAFFKEHVFPCVCPIVLRSIDIDAALDAAEVPEEARDWIRKHFRELRDGELKQCVNSTVVKKHLLGEATTTPDVTTTVKQHCGLAPASKFSGPSQVVLDGALANRGLAVKTTKARATHGVFEGVEDGAGAAGLLRSLRPSDDDAAVAPPRSGLGYSSQIDLENVKPDNLTVTQRSRVHGALAKREKRGGGAGPAEQVDGATAPEPLGSKRAKPDAPS